MTSRENDLYPGIMATWLYICLAKLSRNTPRANHDRLPVGKMFWRHLGQTRYEKNVFFLGCKFSRHPEGLGFTGLWSEISKSAFSRRHKCLSLPKFTHVLHMCKIGVVQRDMCNTCALQVIRSFHFGGYLFTHGCTCVHVVNHVQNIAHILHMCNQFIGHITHVLLMR